MKTPRRQGSAALVDADVESARAGYQEFITSCATQGGDFRLTPLAESTPFASCFAVFGLQLLNKEEEMAGMADAVSHGMRSHLLEYRDVRAAHGDLAFDKPFLQLLTFTLTSLQILGRLRSDPLGDVIEPLLSSDVGKDLARIRALEGVPQSGNLAMFMAILLLHARDYLGIDSDGRIEEWVERHLRAMNLRGFWSRSATMTYLEFQNGYHQYEILDYLGVENPKAEAAAANVHLLADNDGHYAPYPGGGGCYDYDAVRIISACALEDPGRRGALWRTATSIMKDQNADGGFAESKVVRPRTLRNLRASFTHVWRLGFRGLGERLRYGLTLQRPKHDRIATHWSDYSREWSESDLWDSWFRMLTVATVDRVLTPANASRWGFIDYPGIGYQRSARETPSWSGGAT